MAIDVISNTADYSAKLTANFNYFPINPYATRGLSVLARTICVLTQLRTSAVLAVDISSVGPVSFFDNRPGKRDVNSDEIFNLLVNCDLAEGTGYRVAEPPLRHIPSPDP